MRRHAAVVLLAVTLAVRGAFTLAAEPVVPRATEPRGRADALVDQGLAMLRERRYEEAFKLFGQAHDILPTPAIEIRLGFAEQGLARWIDSEIHLEGGLAATRDPWVTQNRAVIERALAEVRRHLGWVSVRGTPDGAVVKLDGITRGLLPKAGPVRVVVGERKIEVRADGFSTEERNLAIETGRRHELAIHLKAAAPSVKATALRPVAVATPAPLETAAVMPTAATPAAEPSTADVPSMAGVDLASNAARSDVPPGWNGLRKAAWWSVAIGLPIGVAGYFAHRKISDHREPLSVGELTSIGAMALGSAAAIGGLSFLAVDWMLVPSEHGAEVALSGRF